MRYDVLAPKEEVKRVMEAVKSRGVSPEFVETKEQALQRLKELIPPGAEVMTGSSTTLIQIGFIELLRSGEHSWKNWKDIILAEKNEAKQNELRRRSVLSEYFLGSAHAIAQTGEMVFASGSGSQLPAYVYTSNNVIWVAGTQKIMPTLKDAIERVRAYVYPLEDARVKREGGRGSTIGKLLVFEREINPARRLTLILVNEKLGF